MEFLKIEKFPVWKLNLRPSEYHTSTLSITSNNLVRLEGVKHVCSTKHV